MSRFLDLFQESEPVPTPAPAPEPVKVEKPVVEDLAPVSSEPKAHKKLFKMD